MHREWLHQQLADEPVLTVEGEADNGQELPDRLPITPADVVLFDLHLPVLDGLATTRCLRAEFPAVRVLVLSQETHELAIGEVLKAGALGYVLNNADKREIVAAIQAVGQRKRFLSSELGLRLLDKLLRTPLAGPAAPGRADAVLMAREREVLQLVADGLTNAKISETLGTSKRTIENHRRNIIVKTGIKNRTALVRYATPLPEQTRHLTLPRRPYTNWPRLAEANRGRSNGLVVRLTSCSGARYPCGCLGAQAARRCPRGPNWLRRG